MNVYAQSKLANAVFGLELQKRLAQRDPPATSLLAHPGVSRTELTGNSYALTPSFRTWFITKISNNFPQPASQGALPSLFAATAADARGGRLYAPHAGKGWKSYPAEEALDKAVTTDLSLGTRLWTA
jgi:protochlorophyllide reductase